jgi:hypothetical protein
MPRVGHGSSATPEQLAQAHAALAERAAEVDLGFAVAAPATLQDFDFLFPELQDDPDKLLPRSATTVKRLKELGRTMVDPGAATGDGTVPAIYTYFGQFVDHDITFETRSFPTADLLAPGLAPLAVARIRDELKNLRTASLEHPGAAQAPAGQGRRQRPAPRSAQRRPAARPGGPHRRPA